MADPSLLPSFETTRFAGVVQEAQGHLLLTEERVRRHLLDLSDRNGSAGTIDPGALADTMETAPSCAPVTVLEGPVTLGVLRRMLESLVEHCRLGTIPSDDDPRVTILVAHRLDTLVRLVWAYFQLTFPDPFMTSLVNRLAMENSFLSPLLPFPLPVDDGSVGDIVTRLRNQLTRQKLRKESLPVQRVVSDVGLIPDSPLGLRVLQAFFGDCPDSAYGDSLDLYSLVMRLSEPQDAGILLERYFDRYRLDSSSRPVNEILESIVGHPDVDPTGAWAHVSEACRTMFWKWIIARELDRRYDGNQRKSRFLQRYIPYMESLSEFDETILVLRFPQFVLLLAEDQPMVIHYLDQATFDLLVRREEGRYYGEHPLRSAHVRYRTAREAIRDEIATNAAILDLEDVGLLYAIDFLNLQVGLKTLAARGEVLDEGTAAARLRALGF